MSSQYRHGFIAWRATSQPLQLGRPQGLGFSQQQPPEREDSTSRPGRAISRFSFLNRRSFSATQSAQPSADKISQLNVNLRSMELGQWKYLISKIDEPTTARIIVEYLDSEPAQKARFAGIYIRARDTVQRSRVRYARPSSGARWRGV
ncbi:MAG: hypothetical protein IPM06_21220 [Rhizobiales bacterium]|nr:hypothetical protein [Hyphomicrobiales bacterium]